MFLHSSTFFSIMKHDVQKFENYRLLQTKRGIAMINSSLSSLYEANRNEFGERKRERERERLYLARTNDCNEALRACKVAENISHWSFSACGDMIL